MDLLLVCKDAVANSLVTNLLLAIEARGQGREAAVLFSSAALATLPRGSFLWPRELAREEVRLAIADSAKALGLPVALSGQARQLDVHAIVRRAREAGVPMYADPLWTDLLGVRGRLPEWVRELTHEQGVKLLCEATKVIGGF